ncbi:hypothetical protein RchiOBHm_Chr5g0055591 [Rosa chinensis]|uniref:Uncharacterized protein n=1 Tax=Rosa chinensis TaxID=74649 RepID=A0A2P6QGF8_ROSCH|nr:hypothetical protein RchiOBHm_Chr5g0055591 [Rosa chinensis]
MNLGGFEDSALLRIAWEVSLSLLSKNTTSDRMVCLSLRGC